MSERARSAAGAPAHGVPATLNIHRPWIHAGDYVNLTARVPQKDPSTPPYVAVWRCPKGLGMFEADPDSTLTLVKEDRGDEMAHEAVTIDEGRGLKVRWRANTDVPEPFPVRVRLAVDVYQLEKTPTKGETASALEGASRGIGLGGGRLLSDERDIEVRAPEVRSVDQPRPVVLPDPISVQLTRTKVGATDDQALWSIIRMSTEALKYDRYERWMDLVFCDPGPGGEARSRVNTLARHRSLPFPDTDPYRLLKVATEVFMQLNCGVFFDDQTVTDQLRTTGLSEEELRMGRALRIGDIERSWDRYVGLDRTLPYLDLVRRNLRDWDLSASRTPLDPDILRICEEILRDKLTNPCLVELIWSYWHEEGMLVQTMKAITLRFQNRHAGTGTSDPLALIEIDPLRPLNNFLWGYIQDEDHRLTVARRAYEYDHHYGFTLFGKAVPRVRGADSRSRFIEGFHNLLYLCSIFFKEDDDTTVVADGFPILNALREVHLLLTQGAHNQYLDLPWASRQEMLMEEWILGRPEFREFLPRRIMVDYPEQWMHSVEAMKALQGWNNADVLHFRDLGVTGERILLSIRFGSWTTETFPEGAVNWARYFRAEIQRYMHAYRAVTGIDLTEHPDATMPGVLLRQRLPSQRRVQISPTPARSAVALGSEPSPRALSQPGAQPASRELAEWSSLESE
jgi:hypothetical protein